MFNFIHQREFFHISVYMCLCNMQKNHMNTMCHRGKYTSIKGPMVHLCNPFSKSRIPKKLTKVEISSKNMKYAKKDMGHGRDPSLIQSFVDPCVVVGCQHETEKP